jgi:hypothetical protein
MANQDAPFGFRAVRMQGSAPSSNGQTQYLIANGYNTAIFQGDPVEMVSGGSLNVANGAADVMVGVLNGVEFIDTTTRKPTFRNFHAADTTAFDGIIKAFVIDDPDQLFEIQVSGAFTNADIGATANLTYAAGSTINGISKVEVNSGAIGTGADSAVKIVGLSGDPENNDTTSNNSNIIVKINKHLYNANTAGI